MGVHQGRGAATNSSGLADRSTISGPTVSLRLPATRRVVLHQQRRPQLSLPALTARPFRTSCPILTIVLRAQVKARAAVGSAALQNIHGQLWPAVPAENPPTNRSTRPKRSPLLAL